jgi:drug/metabolite transporter (DMT)-like permease
MILQLQPITFTACRFTITTVLTCAVRFLLPRSVLVVDPPAFPTRDDTAASADTTAKLVRWGVLCGLFVYLGSVFQQLGLQTVSAGKMSFITGSYVIFVPIFEHLLPCVPSRLTVGIWVSAAISVVGMYFLSGCVDESCVSSIGLIDVTGGVTACFLSMLCWAFLLIGTDLAVRDVDYVDLAIVEDLVVAVLSLCQVSDMWWGAATKRRAC